MAHIVKVLLVGFGPEGLLEQVRQARWIPALPRDNNFGGIGIEWADSQEGVGALCDKAGDGCDVFYKIAVLNDKNEEVLAVQGWSHPGLIREAADEQNRIRLGNHQLGYHQSRENNSVYSIEIQRLTPVS